MVMHSNSSGKRREKFPRLLPLTVALFWAQNAMAQAQPEEPKPDPVTLEQVTVTGSNIRTNTAAEEGSTPVAVITAEDIALLGYKDIKDVLRFDSAVSGASSTEGYDRSVRSTVNLRGLGEKYTLVLLNGRRFSSELAADVSLIPLAAVERIEILKDGASAVYGSDAVAGVVNIITKKSYKGVQLEAYYGNTVDHDASNNQVRMTFGGGDDKLRFLGSLGYTKRNAILSEDRAIAASNDKRPYGGTDGRSSATSPAAFNVPGLGMVRLDTSRFGPGSYSTNPADYVPYVAETDKWDRPFRSVIMPLERTNFYGQVEANPFDNDTTFFGELLYSKALSRFQGGSTVVSFSDPALGPVPGTNPYNPFGVAISSLQYRAYELSNGQRSSRNEIDNGAMRLVGGVRGWLGEWSYEAAASLFSEEKDILDPYTWSKSGLRAAINRPGANAFNPFCYGCNDASQLAGVVFAINTNDKYTMRSFDARASGPLFDNWAGTVSAAAGVEYRKESYQTRPDAMVSAGDILDYGTQVPERNERDVKAAYAELSVPLLGESEHTEGAPALEMNLALRSEEYSDFGSTTNPKLAFRWHLPFEIPVILRASFGTSFKTPQLSQLLASKVSVGDATLVDPLTGLPTEMVVVTGSNPALQPENADYTNFGVVVSPYATDTDRLTFVLDYYRIEQQDIILQPTVQDVLAGLAPGTVDRTPGAAQERYGKDGDVLVIATWTNAGDRNLTGIDFGASWEHKTDSWGNLTAGLSTSYLLSDEQDIKNGKGFVEYAGYYRRPEWRASLLLDWEYGPWRSGFVNRYIGSTKEERVIVGTPKISSYNQMDVSLAYDTTKSGNDWLKSSGWARDTTLKIGVDNLADRQPVFVKFANNFDPNGSDILGRYYYVSITRNF